MLRCAQALGRVLAPALSGLMLVAAAAQAQPARNFPATALRGELVVTAPPVAQLNRRPARLAPGARIRDGENRVVLSGQVVGQKLLVHYTRDSVGNLLDVWLLTPAEAAKKPWPETAEQAAAWRFDAAAQTWSRP